MIQIAVIVLISILGIFVIAALCRQMFGKNVNGCLNDNHIVERGRDGADFRASDQ